MKPMITLVAAVQHHVPHEVLGKEVCMQGIGDGGQKGKCGCHWKKLALAQGRGGTAGPRTYDFTKQFHNGYGVFNMVGGVCR